MPTCNCRHAGSLPLVSKPWIQYNLSKKLMKLTMLFLHALSSAEYTFFVQ